MQTELSLKGLDTNATTRTEHRHSVPRTYCKRLGLFRNVLGTICFDFIRIILSKDALRTLCDRIRSVFGRDERVRNRQGRYEIVLLAATRSHYVPVRPQYGSYVRNTTIVFGTMALSLMTVINTNRTCCFHISFFVCFEYLFFLLGCICSKLISFVTIFIVHI